MPITESLQAIQGYVKDMPKGFDAFYASLPLVAKEMLLKIARFALLALILLFIILALDIAKNLVLRGGKHLAKQGATLLCLMLLFSFVFTPSALVLPQSEELPRVCVSVHDEKGASRSYYLTISQKQALLALLQDSQTVLRLANQPPKPATGTPYYTVQLAFADSEATLYADDKASYYYTDMATSFLRAFAGRENALLAFLKSNPDWGTVQQ